MTQVTLYFENENGAEFSIDCEYEFSIDCEYEFSIAEVAWDFTPSSLHGDGDSGADAAFEL